MMLSDVCLSVAYIGPKSRTERPRNTKIGTGVAHSTRDSVTTFKSKVKVTRLYSPRGLNASGSCSGVLGGASAPTEGGEGRGHIVAAARLQLVNKCLCLYRKRRLNQALSLVCHSFLSVLCCSLEPL